MIHKFLKWGVPVVAVLILVLILLPADIWDHPENDAVYNDFGPELIYVNQKGLGFYEGLVKVTPEFIEITSVPYSQPAVHLLSSTLDFTSEFDITIEPEGEGGTPLSIGLWNPMQTSGFFINFGPPPGYSITTQAVEEGIASSTLTPVTITSQETLGRYSPGLPYHLEMSYNKEGKRITYSLASDESPPSGNPMLKLEGGPARTDYKDIISQVIPVSGDKEYSFGGCFKLLNGVDSYKITLQWLDKEMQHISFVNDWRPVSDITGWTQMEFSAVSPPESTYARIFLGAGNDTELLVSDVFLVESDKATLNLLSNGDFSKGDEGWNEFGDVMVLDSLTFSCSGTIGDDEIPKLFPDNRLPITLSVSSSSYDRNSKVTIEEYSLVLGHKSYQVNKVDDTRSKILTALLIVCSAILILLPLIKWIRGIQWQGTRYLLERFPPITINQNVIIWIIISCVFLFVNALLYNLGSHPFDMFTQQYAAYIGTQYGPSHLYYLPNTVPLSEVWGGASYHEAIFPYNFVFAYYYSFIGWVYSVFLAPAGTLTIDGASLSFLIKLFNALFTLAGGILIFDILKKLNVSNLWCYLGSLFFLFNPAIWFNAAIWGQTQIVSIFLLLLSICLALRRHAFGAWFILALACFTRPQVLIPVFFIILFYLRIFNLKENLRSIGWSIIIIFLILAPLAIAISPSLPKDIIINQLFIQEAGGNEPAMTLVSLDAYSIWPLLTNWFEGQAGLSRMFFPSTSPLIGSLSYQSVSQLITIGIILLTSILIIIRLQRDSESKTPVFLALLALGTVGFLVFKTGLASAHFVLAIPFIILSFRSMNPIMYVLLIGIWTITSLVSMYGSFSLAISNVGEMAPYLHPDNNAVSRFFMDLHMNDRFMTASSIVNLLVFIWLLVINIPRRKSDLMETR